MITFIKEIGIAPKVEQIAEVLSTWLANRLEDHQLNWLYQTIQQLSEEQSERLLFTRFSAAPRQVGKADLNLTAAEFATAVQVRSGWQPQGWSLDQATRSLLLITFPSADSEQYVNVVEKLFTAADVAEQIALYQTLPLFPYPEKFKARAIEGLRTNITAAFNAIALNNPYPAENFDEATWNQMVLKALFVDSHLSKIQGLEQRANPTLARMLSDYAHERWAAGRSVNPQLWRSLGLFAEGDLLRDLERVLHSDISFERQAAALALASAAKPEAAAILDRAPELKQQIATGQLTWEYLSAAHP